MSSRMLDRRVVAPVDPVDMIAVRRVSLNSDNEIAGFFCAIMAIVFALSIDDNEQVLLATLWS